MKLATQTWGSGPRTAALVHGNSMSGGIWRDFAAVLVEKYDLTVIVVDLRGHGDTGWADSYAVEDFAGDLVETLPQGLDFLIGQSLGGLTGAAAVERLQPKRFIGIDPAFEISDFYAILLRVLSPLQSRLPTWALHALGSPPAGAAPDTLDRFREWWKKWDPSTVRQLHRDVRRHPFEARPPAVPSTLVLADPSFAVPSKLAARLAELGWDVRVKPGGVHDLHVQDPSGLAAVLDDVLAGAPSAAPAHDRPGAA